MLTCVVWYSMQWGKRHFSGFCATNTGFIKNCINVCLFGAVLLAEKQAG